MQNAGSALTPASGVRFGSAADGMLRLLIDEVLAPLESLISQLEDASMNGLVLTSNQYSVMLQRLGTASQAFVQLLSRHLSNKDTQECILASFSDTLKLHNDDDDDDAEDDLKSSSHDVEPSTDHGPIKPQASDSRFGEPIELSLDDQDEPARVVESWRNFILDLFLAINLLKNALFEQELATSHDSLKANAFACELKTLQCTYDSFAAILGNLLASFAHSLNEQPYSLPSFRASMHDQGPLATSSTQSVKSSSISPAIMFSSYSRRDLERFVARMRWHHLTPSFASGGAAGFAASFMGRFFLGFGFLGITSLAALGGLFGFYSSSPAITARSARKLLPPFHPPPPPPPPSSSSRPPS